MSSARSWALAGGSLPAGRPGHGVLVVVDGRIAAVGDDVPVPAGVARHDVGGAVLRPGVHDAHVHPLAAGLQAARCDLSGAVDADAARALVTACADRLHPGQWLLGGGLDPVLGAHGEELLAAAGPVPALLLDSDLHGGWANAQALAAAGLDPATTGPHLVEDAVDAVAARAPDPGDADLAAALRWAQGQLHALGVVGWQDALVGAGLGLPDPLPGYLRWAADDGPAPVALALRWDPDRGVDQLADLGARREAAEAAGFRADRVKLFVDGVCEHGTAALLPAADRPDAPATRWPPAELAAVVELLQGAGFTVHAHAVGDRAVREVLDAVEAAAGRHGPAAHQVAHLQAVHPADVPRFAALGVVPVVQPLWACDTRPGRVQVEPVLGAVGYARQYPFGDLVRAGARLAVGSDWPVSDPSPWHAVEVGSTRTACLASAPWLGPADVGAPLGPAQALPAEVWWPALTAHAARACGTGDSGVLAVGARADLVLLDHDLVGDRATGSPGGATVDVLGTVVAGHPVHDPVGLLAPR